MQEKWEPSKRQRNATEWLAAYKGTAVPQDGFDSNAAMWKWLKETINRGDKDIAHEMCIDFNMRCDFNDPFSVIGCLKQYDRERKSESARREAQLDRAMELLKNGANPFSILDWLEIPETELFVLIQKVESEGYLVEGY